MAVNFCLDRIGNGLNLRKNNIGNIKPMKGLTVAPVKVIAELILGISKAKI